MPPTSGGPTRANPAWLLLIAGALLVARIGIGVWDARNPETRPEALTWIAPSAAAQVAESRGRLVLYAFTDRRVAVSRRLTSEVFTDAGIARELGGQFVPVRIEGAPDDDTAETAALRSRFKVTEIPTLVVATPDGAKSKLVTGYTGARATLERLTTARLELMDLPFRGRGGVRFQIGGSHGDGADSSSAGDAAAPDGD